MKREPHRREGMPCDHGDRDRDADISSQGVPSVIEKKRRFSITVSILR